MKVFSVVSYGLFISIIYPAFNHFGTKGGLDIFPAASGIAGLILLICSPNGTRRIAFTKLNILRACAFVATNSIVFYAQSVSSSYNAVTSLTVGFLTGQIVMNAKKSQDKMPRDAHAYYTVVLILLASLLSGFSLLPIVGGIFSAMNSLSTHRQAKSSFDLCAHSSAMLLVATPISVGVCYGLNVDTHIPLKTWPFALLVILTQLWYMRIWKHLSYTQVSTLLLIRIPATLLIEFLVIKSNVGMKEAIGGVLVASFLLKEIPKIKRSTQPSFPS